MPEQEIKTRGVPLPVWMPVARNRLRLVIPTDDRPESDSEQLTIHPVAVPTSPVRSGGVAPLWSEVAEPDLPARLRA